MTRFVFGILGVFLLQAMVSAQVTGVTYNQVGQQVNGSATAEYSGSGDGLYATMSWGINTGSQAASVTVITKWNPGGSATTTTFTIPAHSTNYQLSSNSSFTVPDPAGNTYTCDFTLQVGGIGNVTPAPFNKAGTGGGGGLGL